MKLFSFLAQAMGDGQNPSAMRIAMLGGVAAILGVWAACCIAQMHVLEIPQSVIEVLGLLVVGKVAQTHIESKTP